MAIQCIVDDTALTTNLAEIEAWLSGDVISLVIPLYTIDRLHLLKKDSSQIGQNARKAVKFLDRMTSGSDEAVTLQGPDEQYATWAEVEAHYGSSEVVPKKERERTVKVTEEKDKEQQECDRTVKRSSASGTHALSQMLLDKLNFVGPAAAASPASTPPGSPSHSEPQSSKASPLVRAAVVAVAPVSAVEKSPVPEALKPLLNPVAWYIHEKASAADGHVFFLTNSADTQHLARDFKIPTKTIHQLRSLIGEEAPAVVAAATAAAEAAAAAAAATTATAATAHPSTKKHRNTPSINAETEPKTLFSYEDESEDEEVVFKPRGRGTARTAASGGSGGGGGGGGSRSGQYGSIRGNKAGHPHSPRLSFSTPPNSASKPQIPVEEIDPDSFDRGSFGRGSMPLANTGTLGNHPHSHGHNHSHNHNHAPHTPHSPHTQFNGTPRGPSRNNFTPTGPSRGSNHYRGGGGGGSRGADRGSARGRGRLFVP